MSAHVLEKISQIDKKTHVVFLVTAAKEGDIQADGVMMIQFLSEEELNIRGWFSPVVISNLDNNPHLTLIVWNVKDRQGFQLKGQCIKKKQAAFLDGFVAPSDRAVPQVQWELIIHVDRQEDLCKQPTKEKP